jgi:MOB kinase activator 1
MEAAVKLPKGEDLNEWLAVNSNHFLLINHLYDILPYHTMSSCSHVICVIAVDFFNEISMLYGTISEYCTKGSCPTMSAGPKYVSFLLPFLVCSS